MSSLTTLDGDLKIIQEVIEYFQKEVEQEKAEQKETKKIDD